MNAEKTIEPFSALGRLLRESLQQEGNSEIDTITGRQQTINPWFTPDNVRFALSAIAAELTSENLTRWTSAYTFPAGNKDPWRVAVVFAGNIPLAGFHDFLTVLISGNSIVARTSSRDPELIPFLGEMLVSIDPGFKDRIRFTDGIMSGYDAVIASGSNNSSRYFEYYFGRYPNIIRKNRNSVAILEGTETAEELEALGKDIFTYFGLGCRSVSKIYVPAGYDVKSLPGHWTAFSHCINHSRYANNYDYNKAIYLVNRMEFTDSGFLILREELSLSSPVAVLHYEYYQDRNSLEEQLKLQSENIQCVTGHNHVPFGEAQTPHLWDYADGIDTLEFMLKKKITGKIVI